MPVPVRRGRLAKTGSVAEAEHPQTPDDKQLRSAHPCAVAGHSAASNEGHDDIGGVTIEVLPSSIVDRRRSRVRVAGGDLDVSQRHPGVESGHDESGSQHVRVHESESGPFADGPDPPVGGAAVQTVTIATPQVRAFVTFTDGEIDGAGGPRDERDRCWLVALTDDA